MRSGQWDLYGPGMADAADWPTYLVEHYWPGVSEADFRRSARLVAASADRLARAGEDIQFLHSTLVPEDAAAFCVLAAASADLVERAYAIAGVRYERVVEAIEWEAHTGRRAPISLERVVESVAVEAEPDPSARADPAEEVPNA